ncbi:MAG: aldo/keto reductase, partial [Myxococcota bacterium]
MKQRKLGRGPQTVSTLGLGLMGMSDFYGPSDREESLATVGMALDAGVTWFDTGDFYGSGHNELLLREALRGRKREDLFIAVKFGGLRAPDRSFIGVDLRPASVKNFLAMTLQRLGTDYVDLYQPARLDPSVPIEETVGAMGELVEGGYVRHLGLSEMGANTIRRAHHTHPIESLQIEYSLISRGIEETLLPVTRELGITISAYGVLSRGLLSGHWTPARSEGASREFRGHLPRFQGENLEKNLGLVEKLRTIAEGKGITVAQLAIAWVAAQGEDIVPLIGARTRERLEESLGAADVVLSDAELAAIEAAVPK